MKITKYRMDQLDEAREVQKNCIKQHLPCPPVAWWQARIIDSNGKVQELIESKCNSYTRNGLNLIAGVSMYTNTSVHSGTVFGDGVISFKHENDSIKGLSGTYSWTRQIDTTEILLGTNNEAYSVDYVKITQSSMSKGPMLCAPSFDSVSRKFTNSITRTHSNTSGSDVIVREAGVYQTIWNGSDYHGVIVVRDVLESPITVPNGKSISFTYNFELLYPL